MADKKTSSSRTKPETPLPTDTPKDRGAVSEADTTLALSDQSNKDAAEQVDSVDHSHPLPTDVSGQRDSTGGNAPFAPADITPASADDTSSGSDNTGLTGDDHGTSRRNEK